MPATFHHLKIFLNLSMKGPKNKARGNPKTPMNHTFSAVEEKQMPFQQFNYFSCTKIKNPFYIFSSVNSSHYMLFDHEFQPFKKHDWVSKMPPSRKKKQITRLPLDKKLQFRWLLLDKITRIFKSNLNISEKKKIHPPPHPPKTPNSEKHLV